jgi:IS4 transposase
MLIATDRFDISAEIVALLYRHRWKVELFFRWLKHTLNFRHLLSDTRNGVTIQVYAAIIATLLVAIIGRRKPNKRVYVMISLYLVGLASEEELINYIRSLPLAEGLGA